MHKFTPEFVDEVRSRTNLATLAGKATKLEKIKNEWLGCCPFHTEKTPSFTVVPDKGFYHCFGCGAHGSAIDFIMATENLNFVAAVTALAQEAGMDIPGDPKPVTRKELQPVVVQKNSIEEAAIDREKRRKSAYKRWAAGMPLMGSVAETYLVEARHISEETLSKVQALRFVEHAEYWDKTDKGFEKIHVGPALLAALQWPDGKFAALHTTYLQADGSGKLKLFRPDGKAYPAKRVSGPAQGAAIRLTPSAQHMYVGEGIENTLTAVDVTGDGGWCAYSLDNMCGAGLGKGKPHPKDGRRKLPSTIPDMNRHGLLLPPECEYATYLGDGDTKDLHMLKAKLARAVRRQTQLGLKADYVISPEGVDFNDLLRGV